MKTRVCDTCSRRKKADQFPYKEHDTCEACWIKHIKKYTKVRIWI